LKTQGGVIEAKILPTDLRDVEVLRDLTELSDTLRSADLSVETTVATIRGVKDLGLTTAISLAGLSLSAISTFISVLSYWSARKPQYSVTLEADGVTLQVSKADAKALRSIAGSIRESDLRDLLVEIAKE
jgi:hypothetical protein